MNSLVVFEVIQQLSKRILNGLHITLMSLLFIDHHVSKWLLFVWLIVTAMMLLFC